MGTSPENDLERALMVMYNITMFTQVMDDMIGLDIDTELNIPSYATAAYSMAGGDRNLTMQLLKGKKKHYKTKVRDLGLGFVGRRGAFNVGRAIFEAATVVVKQGKKSEKFRQKLHRLPPRERIWINGGFDTTTVNEIKEEFEITEDE
jgi:hypothetical protein